MRKMSARKSSLVGMKRKRHATSIAAGARRGIAPLDEDAVEAVERECPRTAASRAAPASSSGVVGLASGGMLPAVPARAHVEWGRSKEGKCEERRRELDERDVTCSRGRMPPPGRRGGRERPAELDAGLAALDRNRASCRRSRSTCATRSRRRRSDCTSTRRVDAQTAALAEHSPRSGLTRSFKSQ